MPTDGEISVEIETQGESYAGNCKDRGAATFPWSGFSPQALRYFQLEVADDRRYRIALGMESHYLMTRVSSNCRFMGMPMQSSGDSYDAAVMIGYQDGVLAGDGAVEGTLTPPLVVGTSTVNGRWSFAKTDGQ